MTRTAVIFSPVYYRHNPGNDHPESAKRLSVIVKKLREDMPAKTSNWKFVKPEKARIEDVKQIHDIKYIQHIKTLSQSGGGLLDSGDTVVSPQSFEVALYAVGGALTAIRLVTRRQFENAFALVRPPGHHAGRSYGLGFCIFNNIALAAKHLLQECKLQRIFILDIDAHHGNGTQEIFYETDKVMYASLHEDPRSFPGTGFINQIGRGKGRGYNLNIPLPIRTSDQIYLKALDEIVIPIAEQYEPQFLLVSAGLDCHYADPVGRLSLSALCYSKVFDTIAKLASKTCNGRLVLILEGGYGLRFVGRIAAAAIARMGKAPYTVKDRVSISTKRVLEQGEKTLKEVKKVQRNHWNLN